MDRMVEHRNQSRWLKYLCVNTGAMTYAQKSKSMVLYCIFLVTNKANPKINKLTCWITEESLTDLHANGHLFILEKFHFYNTLPFSMIGVFTTNAKAESLKSYGSFSNKLHYLIIKQPGVLKLLETEKPKAPRPNQHNRKVTQIHSFESG